MWSVVRFQHFIQSWSLYVVCLRNNLFGLCFLLFSFFFVIFIVLVQFFKCNFVHLFIQLKLTLVCLGCTCIINIFYTAMHKLMKSQRIMSAIMEDLDDLFITKDISEQLFGQLKSLNISIQVHLINVDQKSVCTIVKLNHFDVTIFSKSSFNVYTDN